MFQCYRWKYQNAKKKLNFKEYQLKRKTVKRFTRPKLQAALRKLFSLPPTHLFQIKSYYISGTKMFLRKYTEIYRHLRSKCFKNAVLGRQEIVKCKCFCLTPNRNMLAGKSVKSERFLVVLQEHIIFNVKWVEVHKMSEFFWAKLSCKMSDLFLPFSVDFETFC